MDILYLRLSEIKSYERNAKKHPREQVERIAKSLREFGWKQPIVIDRNNVIVTGHGRYLAAKSIGEKKVPCIRADDLTDEQIQAYRLIDNKVSESEWDENLLNIELEEIGDLDLAEFGFDLDFLEQEEEEETEEPDDGVRASLHHHVYENQEIMQFDGVGYYGLPAMTATQTYSDKLIRFCDFGDVDNLSEYICHFYYDDFKFIQAWRTPDKYINTLRKFKAVISPDFSLYTDFPRALQILSCYRRQWCGAYWQSLGLDVIPDVVWGDEESFAYCFDGIPQRSVVAVSSVGVSQDAEWNGTAGERFRAGYNAMLERLEPTKIIFYGSILDGLEGDIIRVPSFYEQRRDMLNERSEQKWRQSLNRRLKK